MATCAGILREKFPQIDEEMFSYINGKVVSLLVINVVKFEKDLRKNWVRFAVIKIYEFK
jgi:hypothetical protein